MEQYTLYANFYDWAQEYGDVADDAGKSLFVYKGIYQIQSTHGGISYPALKHIGSVDLTRRRFIKGAKHPRKIYSQEGNTVCLHNKINIIGTNIHMIERETYGPIRDILIENGYTEDFINEVLNIINTASNDKSVKVDGIVPF